MNKKVVKRRIQKEIVKNVMSNMCLTKLEKSVFITNTNKIVLLDKCVLIVIENCNINVARLKKNYQFLISMVLQN